MLRLVGFARAAVGIGWICAVAVLLLLFAFCVNYCSSIGSDGWYDGESWRHKSTFLVLTTRHTDHPPFYFIYFQIYYYFYIYIFCLFIYICIFIFIIIFFYIYYFLINFYISCCYILIFLHKIRK